MPRRKRAWLSVGSALLWAASATAAAGHITPRTTAELLVDLARDYGLNQRGQQTAADVQHVRALLQAAVRLDPRQAEAYVWLYELAMLDGNQAAAGRALSGLLEADPTNQRVFALWLTTGASAQQTIEKRAEWLQAVATSRRPPALLAMVHAELARLALERMDPVAAREQVRRALELEPANLTAANLALQALDENNSAAERLQAALRVLQLNPASVEAAWQAGLILDREGLADEAARFLDHARDTLRREDPRGALPGGLLLDLARNRMAREQIEEATELARQAIADPPEAAEAGMLLHYLLLRQGLSGEAKEVRQQLAKRFAPLNEPKDWPVNEVAQAAWFYCTIDPQPHLALSRARAAHERAPNDDFVRRVLGWAQALNLKSEEAVNTLAPLAPRDAYAAGMVARVRLEAGDRAGAAQVLESLAVRPTAGPALDQIRELEAQVYATSRPATQAATRPATQPARPQDPELSRVLAEFNSDTLLFHQAPARFLEARVTLDDPGPSPGDPWRATFSLTNRGSFPITLGIDGMVNPVWLLSFAVEGDRQRSYPALTTISTDQVRVLYPGQTVRTRQTLDVGHMRMIARQTPQHLQRVTLQVVLDPEKGPDGEWRPAAGGQTLRPIYFNRVPAATGREALAALFNAVAGDSYEGRLRAIEVLAALLGEQQQAELKRLSYKPAPIPTDRVRSALLSLLGSDSWELRARTLEALQVAGLDRTMTAAVERCLEHPHWLVRMMAVRVLVRQGAAFTDRLTGLAQNDADELVRALSESYLMKQGQR